MSGSRAYVAVVGPGDGAGDKDRALATEVGRLLAERGIVVVCGGLDAGVMAAVAAGAAERGGTVVGLLPGRDRGDAAPGVTVALPTGLGQARNTVVVTVADAVIAVGGSWGTFSEVALALRADVPVVGLNGWQAVDASGELAGPPSVGSAAEAVAWVAEALGLAAR